MNRAWQTTSFTAALGLFALVGPARAAVSDNFNDNVTGSQWTYYAQAPTPPNELNLVEQNQRLEVLSGGPISSATDALYLSQFRLSTAADFEMTLDYSFAHYQSAGGLLSTFGLDFGIGTDTVGNDSAAIAFGYLNAGAVTPITSVGYRNGSSSTTLTPLTPTGPATGTFDIRYDHAADTLTLGNTGGGPSTTLVGLVQGQWHAADVLVSFGARGNGFTTASGDASLDNFTLVTGTLTPEPACLTAVVMGMMCFGRRRAKIGQ